MFIAIMTTLLSPLTMFEGSDPFQNLGRFRAKAEKVEAIELITKQTRKAFGRLKNTLSQRVDELADYYFAQ
jgi:hypothetical protein